MNNKNKLRKKAWEKDQFYTKEEVAKEYTGVVLSYFNDIKDNDIFKEGLTFLEPAAGLGAFYDLFPVVDGIDLKAFDIEKPKKYKLDKNYEQFNFLHSQYRPSKPTIVIGNPPFGYKGDLAFDFLTKLMQKEMNSVLIGMILPNGVNTIKRIKEIKDMGYVPLYTELLKESSFYLDIGEIETAYVDAVFQVYIREDLFDESKMIEISLEKMKNDDFVQVYTINTNTVKNSRRDTEDKEFIQDGVGKKWIGKCDFYLPLRVFPSKGGVKIYSEFSNEDLSNVGFGVIVSDKSMKDKIKIENIYRRSKNKILLTNKQYILKEINRVKNSQRR